MKYIFTKEELAEEKLETLEIIKEKDMWKKLAREKRAEALGLMLTLSKRNVDYNKLVEENKKLKKQLEEITNG